MVPIYFHKKTCRISETFKRIKLKFTYCGVSKGGIKGKDTKTNSEQNLHVKYKNNCKTQ